MPLPLDVHSTQYSSYQDYVRTFGILRCRQDSGKVLNLQEDHQNQKSPRCSFLRAVLFL